MKLSIRDESYRYMAEIELPDNIDVDRLMQAVYSEIVYQKPTYSPEEEAAMYKAARKSSWAGVA